MTSIRYFPPYFILTFLVLHKQENTNRLNMVRLPDVQRFIQV